MRLIRSNRCGLRSRFYFGSNMDYIIISLWNVQVRFTVCGLKVDFVVCQKVEKEFRSEKVGL